MLDLDNITAVVCLAMAVSAWLVTLLCAWALCAFRTQKAETVLFVGQAVHVLTRNRALGAIVAHKARTDAFKVKLEFGYRQFVTEWFHADALAPVGIENKENMDD